MSGSMDVFGTTDVGRKREQNEDQFLIADLTKSMKIHQTSLGLDHQTRLFGNSQGKVLAVADGMGGQAAGERASGAAIDAIVAYLLDTMRWFYQLDDDCEDDLLDGLKAAMVHCQERLHAEAEAMPRRHGMGTTMTLAYLIWPRLYIVHVGDSRCYLCRGGHIEQLTNDHTLAEKFVEAGTLSEDAARTSRWRHVLWNVIGGESNDVSPEVYRTDLELGDAVLLCTDGLTAHVSDDELRESLVGGSSAQQACEQLVQLANSRGGSDNTTVIVARFLETAASAELVAAESQPGDKSLEDTEPYLTPVTPPEIAPKA